MIRTALRKAPPRPQYEVDDPLFINVPFLEFRANDAARPRYRREIPEDLRATIGKREWLVNLKRPGRTASQLVAEVERLAKAHDSLIAALREGKPLSLASAAAIEIEAQNLIEAGPDAVQDALEIARDFAIAVHRQKLADAGSYVTSKGAKLEPYADAVIHTAKSGGVYRPRVQTLSAVHEEDCRQVKRGPAQEKFRAASVAYWIAANNDGVVTQFRRDHVMKFVGLLRDRGNADSSIRRRLNDIRGIWSRHHVNLNLPEPPRIFTGLGLETRDPTEKVLPFHLWHLEIIESYLADTPRVTDETRAAFAVMSCTTLGPAEICRLRAGDINIKDATPHLLVRWGVEGQKGKTRVRYHPLVGAGLDHVVKMKPDSDGRLFKRTPLTTSQTMAKALRAAGVPISPEQFRVNRLRPYSFRHTMRQALADAGAPESKTEYLMGHSSSVPHGYGSAAPHLKELAGYLQAALPLRGNVNVLQYTAEELPLDKR
jgi:integrase